MSEESLNNLNCIFCKDTFNLTNFEVNKLNSEKNEIIFKPKENIIKQGTPLNEFVFVRKGFVKVYKEGKNKNLIFEILKSGDFFNGLEHFYCDLSTHSLSALSDVHICFIDVKVFREIFKSNKDIFQHFIVETIKKNCFYNDFYLKMTQKKMIGRFADGLIYLHEIFKENNSEISLSKTELGDLTNMTTESVFRTMKILIDRKIIEVKRKKILILDLKRLKQVSIEE